VSKVKKPPISVRVKVNNTNDIKLMKYSRPLVATLLMSGGLFQLVAPVLAEGTTANTDISNTATASYEDPNNANTSINATSNTVTVTVAEIAGVIVTNGTITGGTITAGNNLFYNYNVENVGNKATTIHIPGTVAITGPGSINTTPVTNPQGIEYSLDGGTTWTAITAATGANIPAVAVGSTIKVRVAITVTSGAGTTLAVRLGNAAGDAVNEPLLASGASDEVNTVGGSPANGQRESGSTLTGTIGTTAKNVALATVLATRTNTTDSGTPAALSDDVISYKLDLTVEGTNTKVNSDITAAPLAGTDIKVNSSTATKRILVSNAIPDGTKLTAAAVAPSGWTAVYTSDATATLANAATWSTTFSTTPATPYTRVGFVSNIGAEVAAGDTVNNFTFQVTTTNATGTTYTVDSIAQAFGTTSGGTASVIIYDESGDQTPNNYISTAPLTTTNSPLTAATSNGSDTGVALATYGIDTANTNSGTGTYGEINEYTYIYTAPAAVSLLNGPVGVPAAEGLNGSVISNNHDFTNKSSVVPAGTSPTTTINPDAVGFFNTIKNTGTTAIDISLLPEKLTATSSASLPNGTKVRIYTTNGQSASYVSTATGFEFTGGSGSSGGTLISATNPVVTISSVAANGTADYQVEVDLPAGTNLSTSTAFAALTGSKGFPVVINAVTGGTITGGGSGTTIAVSGGTSNKTIDRVYTGFIELVKKSKILKGTGPDVVSGDETLSVDAKTPAPGNIIEYQITYKNISETPVGTGNTTLSANKLAIVEDGTSSSKWGQDLDNAGAGNGVIDTSNVVNSVNHTGTTSAGASITAAIDFYKDASGTTPGSDQTGTTASADVTKYINRVITVVTPGSTGTFKFQRKLN
jgi:hypothetical protein